MNIIKPTLIVDKERVLKNIIRMKEKIERSGSIRFRPHFKTHQSAQIGEWFRELGVTTITVSSVDMALYFAQNGWKDITIAILVNKWEIDAINRMVEKVDLNLLVDSVEMATFLHQKIRGKVKVWIKIDTGYHRTGIEYNRKGKILSVVKRIKKSPKLYFKGLLTHSGHAYNARSTEKVQEIYDDTVKKMNDARKHLELNSISEGEISMGDTPTCSVVHEFYGINEVRCGNFVFYDVMQMEIGSCKQGDIAVALACPVIARYPQRKEIVIFGGAVHLSKENTVKRGRKIYGLVAQPQKSFHGWEHTIKDTYVSTLSQEHGIITTTSEFIQQVKVSDIVMILPVHSCLTVNLIKRYTTIDGEIIETLSIRE